VAKAQAAGADDVSALRRACIICGRPTSGARCPAHTVARPSFRERGYDGEYDRNRRALLATATACWICGQPARPGDPLTADHIIPRSQGGGSSLGNLAPAHRSCNSRRGEGRVEIVGALERAVPDASRTHTAAKLREGA
jgi:ribosomal protein S14